MRINRTVADFFSGRGMEGGSVLFSALVLLFLAGILIRVHLVFTSPLIEYDPHYEFSDELRQHYTGLLKADGSGPDLAQEPGAFSYKKFILTSQIGTSNWHPPAYHIACALLGAVSPGHMQRLVQIFTLLCNLAALALAIFILKSYFGKDLAPVILGANLLVFLPGHIAFSNTASNDILFAPLTALLLLLTLHWELDSKSTRKVVFLSLLCGLTLLTKYTGLVCFAYLNAVFALSYIRGKIPAGKCGQYLLILWSSCFAISGWFYWTNYSLYSNPFIYPGSSGTHNHNFTTFHFFKLLSWERTNWLSSPSVFTGFYQSFMTFDDRFLRPRWLPARNAVYGLGLLPLSLILYGFASSLKKPRFLNLNLFTVIALAATGKIVWKAQLSQGILKSNYLMFLTPAAAVYLAEGLRQTKLKLKPAYFFSIAALVALYLAVAAYYFI